MNKRLVFSWAHIFLFVALIAIAYFNYLGASFATGNESTAISAIWVVAITFMLLFASFFFLQQLKAADHKFERCIVWERILFVVSITMLFVCVQPAWHFANVYDKQNKLQSQYLATLQHTDEMFDKYEKYADRRLQKFDSIISEMLKKNHSIELNDAGMTDYTKGEFCDMAHDALGLQLLSNNYKTVKHSFSDWYGSDAREINVWNIKQVDNIRSVGNFIETAWYKPLQEMSAHRFQIIEYKEHTGAFDEDGSIIFNLKKDIKATRDIYIKYNWFSAPNLSAIIYTLIGLLAMLLPWMLQDRNVKSWVTFWGQKMDNNIQPTEQTSIEEKYEENTNKNPYGGGVIYE